MTNKRWIDWLAIDEVERAPRNPKQHHPDLTSSISRFGFADALILDERTGRLVAGHGRLEALRRMHGEGQDPPDGVQRDPSGKWLVPVQRGWASRTDAEAEAFLVAHNRLTEAGGWDEEELAKIVSDLCASGKGAAKGLGVSDQEVRRLLDVAIECGADHMPEAGAQPVVEVEADPRSKPGETYSLGPHVLACGDSTDDEVRNRLLVGVCSGLVIMDPEYDADYMDFVDQDWPRSIAVFGRGGNVIRFCASMLDLGFAPIDFAFSGEARGLVSAHLPCAVHEHVILLRRGEHAGYPAEVEHLRRAGIRVTQDGRPFSFYERCASRSGPKALSHSKSLTCMLVPMSLVPACVVFDPCAGSGSSLIAADMRGCTWRGIEISPARCDVIRARWGRYAREHGKDPGPDAL